MCVTGRQAPATQSLKRWVPLEFLNQAPSDALAAEVLHDAHIAQPGERRAVGDNASNAYGRISRIIDCHGRDAVAQRLRHHIAADSRRPVGAREHPMDRIDVLKGGVERDGDGHGWRSLREYRNSHTGPRFGTGSTADTVSRGTR